jgi:crotonobetainyl-CoA:carnitine CoA-transferase CaiB-like acyl-CoA transferase
MRLGVAFADVFTGVYSVVGVLAALAERERTGRGAHIDLALFDTMTSVLANQALSYLVSGIAPNRMGNAHPTVVPYQVFPTSDGHMIIAVGNDRQYEKFCGILGVPDLARNPLYLTNGDRVVNRGTLIPQLSALTAKRTRADLLAQCEAAGVPAGPINTIDEVFQDPQIVARGMQINAKSALAKSGTIPGVRTPIVINGQPASSDLAPPDVGEHTHEILKEIGEA